MHLDTVGELHQGELGEPQRLGSEAALPEPQPSPQLDPLSLGLPQAQAPRPRTHTWVLGLENWVITALTKFSMMAKLLGVMLPEPSIRNAMSCSCLGHSAEGVTPACKGHSQNIRPQLYGHQGWIMTWRCSCSGAGFLPPLPGEGPISAQKSQKEAMPGMSHNRPRHGCINPGKPGPVPQPANALTGTHTAIDTHVHALHHICTWAYTQTHMYTHTYSHSHGYIQPRIHTHTPTQPQTRAHKTLCTHIHTDTCIHGFIYTHGCTHIHTLICTWAHTTVYTRGCPCTYTHATGFTLTN